MLSVFFSDHSESEAIGQECPFSEEIQTPNTSMIKEPKIQEINENLLVHSNATVAQMRQFSINLFMLHCFYALLT